MSKNKQEGRDEILQKIERYRVEIQAAETRLKELENANETARALLVGRYILSKTNAAELLKKYPAFSDSLKTKQARALFGLGESPSQKSGGKVGEAAE